VTELGEKIRALREQKALTRSQLASELGVTTPAIHHLENGTRKPSFEMLVKLCNTFGVSSDELVHLSTEPQREIA
jgi:transcriptional regulator with XRE-family HTH domain